MPAGTRWPRITFSFRPTSGSILPARAASVSTLVVSWKLAAEMKLELCTAALVMPSNCVLAVAILGLTPLAGVPPRASIWALACSRASIGHDRARLEVAVALLGDLQALGQLLVGRAELELVHHAAGQQVGVADRSRRGPCGASGRR